MKVIFAGFSKTGTKTMADAFRVLGYTCYDSMEHYAYTGDDWLKIYEKGGSVDDFRRMFDGVDAVTDVPAAHFWEELHEAFPEAKVRFCCHPHCRLRLLFVFKVEKKLSEHII